jgi:hypothetical protein
MRDDGGAVVNIVSGTALYGNVGQSPYAAAKGGLLSLTRSLSIELARTRVRVNAVSPIAMTDMIAPLLDLRPYFGAPEAVAPIVALLATAPITGQVLGFDGRRLSVWSHPAILRREEREEWSLDDLALALDGELAELQPDELGAAVLGLMGIQSEARTP